jgi:hypothetical protein
LERDALADQVVAIQAIAQHPKPDPGRLARLDLQIGPIAGFFLVVAIGLLLIPGAMRSIWRLLSRWLG